MDPVLATLQGVVARLRLDPAVTAFTGQRVFDRAPEGPDPASPYVSLGPHDATTTGEFLGDCVDGVSLNFQIDIWSWGAGEAFSRAEVSKIAAAVRKALHGHELEIGSNTVEIIHNQTRILRDPDGITNHGIMSFEALVDL